jgi:hypothetical protein
VIRPLALFAIGMVLGTTLLIGATDDGHGLCETPAACIIIFDNE